MGIPELISGFISTPGKVFSYVQENILKTPKTHKRGREDSTDGGEQGPRVARLKLSLIEPEEKAASRLATLSGNTPRHRADGRVTAGEVISPPAPWLQKQKEAQAQAQRILPREVYFSSPAVGKKSEVAVAQPRPIELWSSIRARRHGPQTGFRPFHSTDTPAKTAKFPLMAPEEEERTRQRILQDLRLAGKADMDADVKAKQMQARRAELLFKLKQSEIGAAGVTPQPLGGQGEQIPRRLYMSSSAGLTQACRPAPQTPDQAQPSSTEGFFISATPFEEQKERAMQQVLQEREEADKKACELAQVKAEFAELKARLQKAEEKKHVILERAQRVMEGADLPSSSRAQRAMDGTDPASSSRRSLGQALAREIKLAEEVCRRLEAQRQHRMLQYAAAQPLPEEAAPGTHGVLRRTESPGDSASSQLQHRQALKPVIQPQAKKAKAVQKQREEEAIVLLSSSDEEDEEQQEERSDEEESETDEEEESTLSEALDDVHVDADAARQPSKKRRALAAKGLGPGPAAEVVAYHKPSNIEMPRRLLRCLNGLDWLNDEVMNIYMGLLQVRDANRRKAGLGPKCHFFNSFFVNKLWKDTGAYCYANVARWTAQKKLENQGQGQLSATILDVGRITMPVQLSNDCQCAVIDLAAKMSATILDVDRIIMPVHLGNHWTCAVIDLAAKELVYYDSMGGRHMDIMNALRRYVADEYDSKMEKKVDTSEWKIRFPTDIPYQTNGSDCGVFALQYAEHVSRDAAFGFDQQDMPYLRLKIAADIMSLNIL